MLLGAVSFMITWRLGRSTERWWEARRALQSVTVNTLRATRMAAAHGAPRQVVADVVAWCITWLRCLKSEIVPGTPLRLDMVRPDEGAILRAARGPHQLAAVKVAHLLRDVPAGRGHDLPGIMSKAFDAMDVLVTLGSQCLPQAISILATGYCEFFLILYAFAPDIAPPSESAMSYLRSEDGSHDKAHTTIIVTTTMWLVQYTALNLLLLGTDEVATQLERPFDAMPLDALLAATEDRLREAPDLMDSLLEAGRGEAGSKQSLGVPPGVTKLPPRPTSGAPAPLSPWQARAQGGGASPSPLRQRDVEAQTGGPYGVDEEAKPMRSGRQSHGGW